MKVVASSTEQNLAVWEMFIRSNLSVHVLVSLTFVGKGWCIQMWWLKMLLSQCCTLSLCQRQCLNSLALTSGEVGL